MAPAWAKLPECEPPLTNWLWQVSTRSNDELILNHILETEHGYEVLMPNSPLTFRIVKVQTLEEAKALARSIAHPLDLRGILNGKQAELEHLLQTLKPVAETEKGLLLEGRTKEFESLKNKLFIRVRKMGNDFRLTGVDDMVGARIAVETPEQVRVVAERIQKLSGVKNLQAPEVKVYPSGYRAIHLQIGINPNEIFEVQIMTRRMREWTRWNAARVYKPQVGIESPYFKALQEYDKEVVEYVNALDAGAKKLPTYPQADKLGILPQDRVPIEALK